MLHQNEILCYDQAKSSSQKRGAAVAQYSIIRMQKFKNADLQGIQKHNQRQAKNSSNKDIDPERTKLNYDLVNQEKIKYESAIKSKIAERVKRKTRDNSVVLCEFLISASPEYMQQLSPEEQKRYFQTSLEHIQEKYGQQNVLYASVHMDEANPHMHLGITPITDDNRLSAKDMFNGRQVMVQLQTDFNKYVNEKGFELDRGESSDRKNIEVHKFKKEKLEENLVHLEAKVVEKEKNLHVLAAAAERVKPLKDVKVEKGSLFGSKTVKLAVSDFEGIKTLAEVSEALKTENKALISKNEDHLQSIDDLNDKNAELIKKNKKLQQEKEELKKELESTKRYAKELELHREYLGTIVENIKIHSQKRIGIVKEKMGEYVGRIRVSAILQHFGKALVKSDELYEYIPRDEQKGARAFVEVAKAAWREKEARSMAEEKEKEKAKEKELLEKKAAQTKRRSKDDFEMER